MVSLVRASLGAGQELTKREKRAEDVEDAVEDDIEDVLVHGLAHVLVHLPDSVGED